MVGKGEKKKTLVPTMFSAFSKKETITLFKFILLYANANNIISSKISLILYQTIQRVTPFPNKPWFFTCLQDKSCENTMGKGEIACNEQFLLFPQCFLPVLRTLSSFIRFEIVVCKLFQSKICHLGKG